MFIAATTVPVWATVVLAVVPSLIAVIAIVVGKWQQDATFRHERDQQLDRLAHERLLADLRELRTVLDECARALYRARDAQAAFLDSTGDKSKLTRMEQVADDLVELLQRINVRLGAADKLAIRLVMCVDAMLEFLGDAHMEFHEVEPAFPRMLKTRSRFDEARDAVIAEASRRAGLRLPEPVRTAS